MRDDGRGERGVPRGAVGVRADRLDEGRDPGALGPGEPLDAGAVGSDGDDLRRVAGSAVASSSAWSSVPEPDTSTTTRAGTGSCTRKVLLGCGTRDSSVSRRRGGLPQA